MFFFSRIKSVTAAGKHASQAVHDLDDQRGLMSVPQFHSSLQQKRKWPHASAHLCQTVLQSTFDEFLFARSFFLSSFFLFSLT
jgi:hypothetical protein